MTGIATNAENAGTRPRALLHSIQLEREHKILLGVLLLGLLHGLLIVFAMPPWQHYEEPSHFEYAWLIASHLSLPHYPAYDQEERRQIASSMIQHQFFKGMGGVPDLAVKDQPIWIGTNVTGALPLYHILVAVPLRFFLHTNVDTQLYIGRFLSLGLYLLTIWLAYKIIIEFVPPGHPLRWSVPLGIALLPGLADLMTAVSNDVGATFFFSLFMYSAVRLMLHGPSLRRLVGIVVTTSLCLLTKNTVIIAFPLALVAISLVLPLRWRLAVWGLFAISLIVIAGLALSWEDASEWYRRSLQEQPTRVQTTQAPLGEAAIRLVSSDESPVSEVSQPLPDEKGKQLYGKRVTIGAWIWASVPVLAHLPMLSDGNQTVDHQEAVGVEPSFHVVQATVSSEVKQITIILRADQFLGNGKPVTVYYDGVVLLKGEYSPEGTILFSDPQGNRGTWDGQPFTNLVRDGSGEITWPSVRPWVEKLSKQFPWTAHLTPTGLVASLLDWQVTRVIYASTAEYLFETFWGRFGWGHIPMPSSCYDLLKIVLLLGLAGAVLLLWQKYWHQTAPRRLALGWLGVTTVALWIIVFVRGFFGLIDGIFFIPAARYAFPVVIPTLIILTAGWWVWLGRFRKFYAVACGVGFVLLNMVSLGTILRFYGG
ncbi:MAG: hypothetical protein M1132_05205 [Chloroflexi bacterium]|nr:hypothetical protein [Chloroflexota bacterium]